MPAEVTRRGSLVAALLALASQVQAADVQKVDVDFLEFLGSDDSDDKVWGDLVATADKVESAKGVKSEGKKAEPDKKVQPAEPKKGDS